VGRLRYYKGLQYLVEALAMVSPNIRLIIVGIGPMETSLREQVAQLGLGERVSFVQEVSDEDLPNYYAAADVFVLPSCERSEAFGLVQVEAMAAGLPVISTELGTGTSYVNLNNETGLIVPPANPAALAQAINTLATQPELRLTLGTNARQRAIQEFSLDKMVERVKEIYLTLIKES
jgi:rhamnosyl/mannosyltransferase